MIKVLEEQKSFINKIGASKDVILAIDDKKNISFFNKAAEKLFGYKAEEILGQPLVILLPIYTHRSHDKYVDKFSKSGDKKRPMGDRMAVSGVTKNGDILILDVSIEKHNNEKLHRYSAVCRNLAV